MLKQISDKKQNKFLKQLKYWGFLNLGVFLLAFSVYMFSAPNKFTIGGMGGLSIIIATYTAEFGLTQPVILAILNGFMLVLGLIFLGKQMTLRTIICTTVYSLEVYLMDKIYHIEQPLTDQPVLELIYCIIIMGSGLAIIFNCGASSGGTDIIALIFKKYTKMNIAMALLIADFAIACLSFFTTGENGFMIGLCSVLGVFAKSFVIDGVIDNITKTKYVTIITVNPDVVAKVILENINRGFTKYDAQGGYTGEPRTIIITVCRRSQAVHLKSILHQVDPTAFVIITDANEILGKGFAERM